MTFLTRLQQHQQPKANESDEDCNDLFDDLELGSLNSDDDSNNNNNNNSPPRQEQPKLSLRIQHGPSQVVMLNAFPQDTVASLKQRVLQAIPPSTNSPNSEENKEDARYIRLIVNGRLLAPDSARLEDFSQITQHVATAGSSSSVFEAAPPIVVYAVVTHQRPGAQHVAAQGAESFSFARLSRRALRGTGIDAHGWAVRRQDNVDDEEEDETEFDIDEDTNTNNHNNTDERLGFDRLRDTLGLRRPEISAIRTYFNRSVERWIRDHPELADQAARGESDLVRRRQLHEQAWMEAQGPASEFRRNLGLATAAATGQNNNRNSTFNENDVSMFGSGRMGTDRDFMWGFMLGFFVGFLMLLWVWLPSVPHKQKLGILMGISVQIALGMLESPQAKNSGGGGFVPDDLVISDY